MKQFITVIVKPTLDCNLQCRHCYHRPSECSKDKMSIETFEKTVKLIGDEYDSTRFIWHGGEPLLLDESFYKKAIAVEKKYYGKNLDRCENTIQTNGTMLKPRFIEFCKGNWINLGVSYEGGFEKGMRPNMDVEHIDKMVEYMVKKKHMFLISATIHGGNVNDMGAIYEKFKGMGASLSFNPVIDLGCANDNPDLHLDADVYAEKSIEMFDRWIHDVDVAIPVLPYYQYILNAINGPNISDCPHASCLGKWVCVYPNGDLYPCGKACPPEFRLGNINEIKSISEIFESDGFGNILSGSIDRREKCKGCEIYDYCNGGCSIDAKADGDITSPNGFSCIVYKKLFLHIQSTLNEIMNVKPDLSQYNRFIKDAIVGKLINPKIYDASTIQ